MFSPRCKGGIDTVINSYIDNGFVEDYKVKLISTYPDKKRLTNLFGFLTFLKALLAFVYYALINDVNVVHIHSASRGSFVRKAILMQIAKILNSRVIFHLHGGGFADFYNNQSPMVKSIIKGVFNRSDLVIVLSEFWFDWVSDTFGIKNVRILNNSVKKIYFDTREQFLTNNPVDNKQQQRILFLGRLCQEKGIYDLIYAFKKVLDVCPGAVLTICGDGEIEECIDLCKELGVTDSVEMPGWVNGKKKNNIMASSTIFCLPSHKECLPMSIIEAMSCGLVVVSSECGGIPDVITDKHNGLLITPRDREELAEKLIFMLVNPEFRKNLAKNAEDKFNRCFDSSAMRPRLEAIYNALEN